MFDPTAMIMADTTTRRHVLSARPQAQTRPEPSLRRRRTATRHRAAAVLRRLADRVEPCRVTTHATAT